MANRTERALYLKNAHGDITAVTDVNGNVQNTYIYDAFGNQLNENENDTNPFRYCGEYYDKETGDIYLRNRYYAPCIGRFITEDPIKDGFNWYVYVGNNPVSFVDPCGLRFTFDKNVTEDECNLILQSIQNLTRDDIFIDDKGYISFRMVEGRAKSLGTELVREMLDQKVDGIIMTTTDSVTGNTVQWNEYEEVIKPVITLYSPLNNWVVGMYNSQKKYEIGLFTTDMILGHEFIHVYNSLYGLYIPDYGLGVRSSKAIYMYTNKDDRRVISIERTEELNTSGIPYIFQIYYDENGRMVNVSMGNQISVMNENALRREMGYDIRASY